MPEFQFPLKEHFEVCEGTMAFVFDTRDTNFSFEAGQNIDIYLPDAPASGATSDQMHTFSFASAPQHSDHFMITTRMRDSKFKNALKSLATGTKLRCVGPNGNMVLHDDTQRPAVFLAGGIGITPFRSLIESAVLGNLPHELHLFYSNRTLPLTAFHTDLEAWAAQRPAFQYHPTLTDEPPADWKYLTGKIDFPMLQRVLEDITKPIYYIAGPDAMVLAMRKMLIDGGISRDNIRLEAFSGY